MKREIEYDTIEMMENIVKTTVGLQNEFILNMADQVKEGDEDALYEISVKKGEITLGNKAIDDVKMFY